MSESQNYTATIRYFMVIIGTYDCSSEWILSHRDKTDDQFRNDCQDAIRYATECLVTDAEKRPISGYPFYPTDCIEKAVQEMVSKYGYCRIIPVNFYIHDPLIFDGYSDGEAEWRSILGDTLYKRVSYLMARAKQSALDGKYSHAYLKGSSVYHRHDCRYVLFKPYGFLAKKDLHRHEMRPCKVCRPEVER